MCLDAACFRVLSAQSPDMPADKVFAMKSLNTPQNLDEVANVFRQVASASSVTVDTDGASVHAWGTLDQMALSQWFTTVLDEPIEGFSTRSRSLEHPNPDDPNDVAIVEYLPAGLTSADLQDVVTTLRQVAEINHVFPVTARRVIALRGSPAQIATANWVVDQAKLLPGPNAPGPPNLEIHQYRPDEANPDDVMAIFIPAQARDPKSIEDMASALRSEASIRFMFEPRGAIVVRGTRAQIAQAQRLIAARDHPPTPPRQ